MAGLLIFASVNGLAPRAINSVINWGWNYAVFDTFDVSVIVWGAWVSACYLALRANDFQSCETARYYFWWLYLSDGLAPHRPT